MYGPYLNDMMRFDADGRITDFTVMVRPLRAVNRLIEEMGRALQPIARAD